MIGSPSTQPRLGDYKPTREHWVLMGVGVMALAIMRLSGIERTLPPNSGARILFELVVGFSCIWGFAQAKGGLSKVASDWFDANAWGYYWVQWLTSPNSMDGHVVNRQNYDRTVMPRWNLYVPLGGWFNGPFFALNGKRSRSFTVVRVKWDWIGTIESITVRDNDGNRLTSHPWFFLSRLERLVREDGTEGRWTNGILVLMQEEVRSYEREWSEAVRDRDKLRGYRHTLSCAVDHLKRGIRLVITETESGDRLKTSREWKVARGVLAGLAEEPKGLLYDAMRSPLPSVPAQEAGGIEASA